MMATMLVQALTAVLIAAAAFLVYARLRAAKTKRQTHWNPMLNFFSQHSESPLEQGTPPETVFAQEPYQNCAIIFSLSKEPKTFVIPNVKPFNEYFPFTSGHLAQRIRQTMMMMRQRGYSIKILQSPSQVEGAFFKPVLNENFVYQNSHAIQFPANFINLN
jgi:hypothetical protein